MISNSKKGQLCKYLEWSFIFIGFLALFFHSKFRLLSFDIWWYLRNGQFILENKFVPHVDFYSHSAFGQPWVNHHWLTQIIYFLIYKSTGFSGILLFKGIIITATFFILFEALKIISKSSYLAFFVTALAFLCSAKRFFLRAETISYLFLCLLLYVLILFKTKKKDWLWMLPILMVPWVNSHATALIGCAILFIAAISEYLRYTISLYYTSNEDIILGTRELRSLWIAAIFVFAVSFFNINGFRLHLFLAHQGPAPLAGLPLRGILEENMRPGLMQISFYTVFLYTCLTSMIFNYRGLDFTYLLLFLLGFSLSQLAIRHIEIFAILSSPFLAMNMKSILARIGGYLKGVKFLSRFHYAVFFRSFTIVLLLSLLLSHKCYSHILELNNIKVHRGRYPVGAVTFIEENNIDGRMFNTYGFGGYLIWKLYPKQKVFIDGRLVCYLNGVFEDYWRLFEIPTGNNAWKDIFDKYNIDYAVLNYSLATNEQNLPMNLFLDKNWILVYWDEVSMVYVKDTPKFKDIIKRHTYHIINPIDPSFQNLINERDYQRVVKELERKIEEDPECFLAYDRLGIIYEKQGNLKKAAEYFKKVVNLAPYSATSHFNLGLVNQKLGLYDKAIQSYRLALRFDKNHSKAYTQMGLLNFIRKDYYSAIRYFKKAIKVHKEQTDIELAYLYLGASYHNIGRYKTAESMYKKALDINPDLEDARENLNQLTVKGLI